MSIEFACPTCGGTLRVGAESAGLMIRCGACLTALRVPEAAAEAAPPTHGPSDAPLSPFEDPPGASEPAPRPRGRTRTSTDDRSYDDRSSDDRPRRRRRRPPPPPGRGPLFWLAIVGGLMVLLVGGCCGGLYLLIPGPNWRAHESAKGGFKVDLPAPARNDMDKIAGSAPDPNMTTEGTILLRAFEEYAIVYGDVPLRERQGTSDKERIDAAVESMRTSSEVQSVLSQKDITVNGFPGREVEFRGKGSGYYATRIVVADGRVYVLVAGGKTATPGNANVRRFLDSFEITDPKLRAAGEKRVAAAKQAAEQERLRQERAEQDRLAREKAEAEGARLEAERHKEAARVAEEKRKAEEAVRQKVRLANKAFLEGSGYDGPAVPAVEQTDDVRVFSFEDEETDVIGPGVRGKAGYATRGQWLASLGDRPGVREARLRNSVLGSQRGYTLSGWVRVRDNPFAVFLIPGGPGGSDLVVTLNKRTLAARTGGPHPLDLKHTWSGDDGWHHVAFVVDRSGPVPESRLHLDGALVASDLKAVPAPAGPLYFGWTVPKGDRRAPIAAHLYPPGTPEPADGEIVGAMDECAVFGRPLSAGEVAALAGRELLLPLAPAPRAVRARPTAPAPRPVERD